MSDTPILEVENLQKRFGGIVAVDGATFDVERGSVTGLIGPNGAGKTTTFNLITGQHRADGGRVRFNGTDTQELMEPDRREQGIWLGSTGLLTGGLAGALSAPSMSMIGTSLAVAAGFGVGSGIYLSLERLRSRFNPNKNARPHQLARNGLARTFQITRELEGMTVLENLMLAPSGQIGEKLFNTVTRGDDIRSQEGQIRSKALEMLEFLEIEHLASEEAGGLSGGQRKLLELGRVLMTDPELLMLDEPVAGVNPTLTQKILERLESLRERGHTFFIIEHDMDVIMDISDTIIVMHQGDVLTEGTPTEVRSDERVIEAYLGGG